MLLKSLNTFHFFFVLLFIAFVINNYANNEITSDHYEIKNKKKLLKKSCFGLNYFARLVVQSNFGSFY
jgi:hypothetical protein